MYWVAMPTPAIRIPRPLSRARTHVWEYTVNVIGMEQ